MVAGSELCDQAAELLERCDNPVMPDEAVALRDRCRDAGDTPAEAMALQAMCMAYYDQGQVEECLAAAREAHQLFERTADVAKQGQVLLTIAEVRLAVGWGHDIARRSAQRARACFRQAGPDYAHGVARAAVLQCQAQVCVLLERPQHVHTGTAWAEALAAAQEAEDLARGLDELGLAAAARCAAAKVHVANKRHLIAVRVARSAADLYSSVGSPGEVAKALLLAAEAAAGAGKGKEARELGLRAKDIAKEVADQSLATEVEKALANVGQDKVLDNLIEAGKHTTKKMGIRSTGEESAADGSQGVSRRETMQQVLGSDLRNGTTYPSPIMRAGPPSPFPAFGTSRFLALGQNPQANAVLAMMKNTDMETFHLRPLQPMADPAEVPPAAGEAAEDAVWVAPVRKRMEAGAQARPYFARQGVNLRRLSPWAN